MSKNVWVTKYALSIGIKECEIISDKDGYVSVVWKGALNDRMFLSRRHCFDLVGDAITNAQKMREKKIASLKKAIAKLEKMSFN